MKDLLNMILRNAPDGGSGGAAAPAAGGDGAAATTPAGGQPQPGAEGGAAAAGAGGSIAGDPPAGTPAPVPAGDLYRPEGLADQYLGKSNTETIDNLKKAIDGYRQRDSQQQIPEKAEAYGEFGADIPAEIKPHLDTLAKDPLFARMNEKALALRLPAPAYQALVKDFISVSAELGMMEPVIDEKAERAALVPDTAKHLPEAEQTAAVNRRMDENYAWLDAMAARAPDQGGIGKDDAEFAKAMLGDSAKGHRFFEWMRARMGGNGGNGPAMGLPANGGQGDPKAEISRRAALPENTWGNPKFDQKSYDQLVADRRRVYGEG